MRTAGSGKGLAGVRGAVTVEAALVLVPLLLLVFGLVELMAMFAVAAALETSAAAAARVGSLGGAMRVEDATAAAQNAMLWYAKGCVTLTVTDFASLDDVGQANGITLAPTAPVPETGHVGLYTVQCQWWFWDSLVQGNMPGLNLAAMAVAPRLGPP